MSRRSQPDLGRARPQDRGEAFRSRSRPRTSSARPITRRAARSTPRSRCCAPTRARASWRRPIRRAASSSSCTSSSAAIRTACRSCPTRRSSSAAAPRMAQTEARRRHGGVRHRERQGRGLARRPRRQWRLDRQSRSAATTIMRPPTARWWWSTPRPAQLVQKVPTGNGSRSLAVNLATGRIYVATDRQGRPLRRLHRGVRAGVSAMVKASVGRHGRPCHSRADLSGRRHRRRRPRASGPPRRQCRAGRAKTPAWFPSTARCTCRRQCVQGHPDHPDRSLRSRDRHLDARARRCRAAAITSRRRCSTARSTRSAASPGRRMPRRSTMPSNTIPRPIAGGRCRSSRARAARRPRSRLNGKIHVHRRPRRRQQDHRQSRGLRSRDRAVEHARAARQAARPPGH